MRRHDSCVAKFHKSFSYKLKHVTNGDSLLAVIQAFNNKNAYCESPINGPNSYPTKTP